MEVVFDAYFVGLTSDQAQQLTQAETLLGSFGKHLITVQLGDCVPTQDAVEVGLPNDLLTASSPEPINHWRSHTVTILKKEAKQKLGKETARVTETLIARVNRLLGSITDAAATSDARDQGLRALISNAVELSRLLVVQKAIFKVAMPEILPHQRTVFDPATMEDVGGGGDDDDDDDDEGTHEREISCVVFPGIIKRGDESGGHLQYRNVVAKARVLCNPE